MSSQLTDVEAKFLLDQSNRRAKLLRTVQGSFLGYLFSYWILGSLSALGALILISILAQAMFKVEEDSTILSLVLVSTIIIPAYVINRRMDAMVALLREDGLLQSVPPATKLIGKQ